MDQRSHDFTTTTDRAKKEKLIIEGLMHRIRAKGKSMRLLSRRVSDQGNDTQCQLCGAGAQKCTKIKGVGTIIIMVLERCAFNLTRTESSTSVQLK